MIVFVLIWFDGASVLFVILGTRGDCCLKEKEKGCRKAFIHLCYVRLCQSF